MSIVLFHMKHLGNLLNMLQGYVIVPFLCFSNWAPKAATDWQGVSPVTKQEEGGRRRGITKEKAADILRMKRKAFS